MIDIKNLTFTYSGSNKPSLNNVSLSIEDSEFVLITGPSGCGKSSLCRCINSLIPSFYGGVISGSVKVQNIDATHASTREMAKHVGMVFQDPENQLIATDVEREIAFGLENFGYSKIIMSKRVEEVLDAVGIDHLRHDQIFTLSGGEKQKIAIASVLALHPEILILDEPTSELDPKGAEEIIQLIKRLNEELGLTVVLVEHRIDRVLSSVDRLVVMNNGEIFYDGTPKKWLYSYADDFNHVAIPPVSKLGIELRKNNIATEIPLTVKEGRQMFPPIFNRYTLRESKISKMYLSPSNIDKKNYIINIEKLWFKYPEGSSVIRNLSLKISEGEFVAFIGRNASGKTTLAKLLMGLLKPTKGRIKVNGMDTAHASPEILSKHIGIIFQNPNMHLFADTVEDEITFMMKNMKFSSEQINEKLDEILKQFNLEHCRKKYPQSLSSGEKQRVALASVIAAKPKILVLDEPTHGLDYSLKYELMQYLTNYQRNGGTVLLISHDIELISEFSNRVVLIMDGRIVADGSKHQILSKSIHFSSQINKLIQPFADKYGFPSDILTVDELMERFK